MARFFEFVMLVGSANRLHATPQSERLTTIRITSRTVRKHHSSRRQAPSHEHTGNPQMPTATTTSNGYLLRDLARAALAAIATNQDQLNALNVFPVPDGDTGTT